MYSRIVIFGRPGSGKSTFALKLHKKTGLPLYHLDQFYFVENWKKQDYQKYLMQEQEIVNQDRWIIDGNQLRSLDLRYSRADLVLYFNFPRYLCIWRLFKRLFVKDSAIQDRAYGCREAVRWDLLTYTWTYEYRKNYRLIHQLVELKKRYPNVRFIEIKNDDEAQKIYELF